MMLFFTLIYHIELSMSINCNMMGIEKICIIYIHNKSYSYIIIIIINNQMYEYIENDFTLYLEKIFNMMPEDK